MPKTIFTREAEFGKFGSKTFWENFEASNEIWGSLFI